VATLLGAGTAAYNQADYNAATQLFEQATERAPTDAAARYDLGLAYQGEHRDADALVQYRKALSYDPTLVSAIFNEATIYGIHDTPLAIFLYRKVISLQAKSPTAYLNLGLLEAQDGQPAPAGADLRQAVRLEPALRARIPPSVVPDLSLPPPGAASRRVPTTSPAS
jgi:Flp pilus assembly protein TadD